jgi:hypothetical protein
MIDPDELLGLTSYCEELHCFVAIAPRNDDHDSRHTEISQRPGNGNCRSLSVGDAGLGATM